MSDLVVNLEQLATVLGVSLPTMRQLLRRYPDFPVVERGTNGRAWQFDKDAAVAFVQGKRAEKAAAHDKLLSQVQLPLDALLPPEERTASPADRLALARAMKAEDEVARARGELVFKPELRPLVTEAWAGVAKFLAALPETIGRRYNLPEAAVRDIRRLVEEQQDRTVAALRELLLPHVRSPLEEREDVSRAA